ncbi:DUF1302 domain-containing protein [Hahella sp. SMD15-11]|uniref:DUF1302 domain-containing protein n=1 Tax=Thermohahella caldifontis TaxID=3142973 RepID=A0AB39V073_9GAMM
MTRKTQGRQWAQLPLAAAIAALVVSPVSSARQFYLESLDADLSWDTTISAGASWRVSDRDENQLAQGNLGVPQYSTRGSSTNNTDDGNWNFKKGETYSKVIKLTTDLMLRKGDFGGFIRGKAFYDKELMDEGRAYDNVGQTRELSDDALDQAGARAEILDAYVWGDFYLGEGGTPLNLRAGKQVISWGESTFIQGGINIISPIDATAFHTPGAEVKEVLLPVNLVYGSLGLTEDVTLEAFYQLQWDKTRIDPCGTFWSTNDFGADGCGPVLLAGQTPDGLALANGVFADRLEDVEPSDSGQFGLAARWYAAALNDTEFGFYYINYHSRIPYVSGVVADPANGKSLPSYFVEFPEDIHLWGISFNTSTESGWSVSGEVSYRPNLPVQANAFELIYAGLAIDPDLDGVYEPIPYSKLSSRAQLGQPASGYDRFKVTQAQVTFIKFFDQILGASRLTFVTEVGGQLIHNLPSKDVMRYGRDSTFGIGDFYYAPYGLSCTDQSALPTNNNPSYCTNDGFVTRSSWGYRMRFALDYNDAFAGVNLTPILAWSHDVNGYSAEPGAQFKKGRKAVGLTLKAVYLNQYTGSISYTNIFGGKPYNLGNDRDNVSVSVSYSF